MFDIQVNCESRYKADGKYLRKLLAETLESEGIKRDTSVSVLICGRRKVRELSRRYLKAAQDHNVLSFAYNEVTKEFSEYPDNILRLGDIVICYPLAQEQAMEENKMIDQVVGELAQHGLLHLLGKHHDEETAYA